MKPDKPEPGSDPIIGDGAARFTVVLFLALFTLGVALLIWRGLSSVPEGDHRIDQVMGALHAFSTFAVILLVLYLVIAARVVSERCGGPIGTPLSTRIRGGPAPGCSSDSHRTPARCGGIGQIGRSWLKPPAGRADPSLSPRPGRETPGVDVAPHSGPLRSVTAQNHLPRMGRRESP